MFVYLPVRTPERLPAPVEVIGIFDIGVRFADIAETYPQLYIPGDVVTRIQFDQNFWNLGYDIPRGVDAGDRSVAECNACLILLTPPAAPASPKV